MFSNCRSTFLRQLLLFSSPYSISSSISSLSSFFLLSPSFVIYFPTYFSLFLPQNCQFPLYPLFISYSVSLYSFYRHSAPLSIYSPTIHQKPVMSKLPPAAELHKSDTPLCQKEKKNSPPYSQWKNSFECRCCYRGQLWLAINLTHLNGVPVQVIKHSPSATYISHLYNC